MTVKSMGACFWKILFFNDGEEVKCIFFSITDEMGINSTTYEINQNYILEKWALHLVL